MLSQCCPRGDKKRVCNLVLYKTYLFFFKTFGSKITKISSLNKDYQFNVFFVFINNQLTKIFINKTVCDCAQLSREPGDPPPEGG